MMAQRRSSGIASVDALFRKALVNPEKERLLISKMPASTNGGKLQALSAVLRREPVVGTQAVDDREKAGR